MLDFIFSGVLDRFPGLVVFLAEIDCGWLPYFAQQADDNYRRHSKSDLKDVKFKRLPSEYMKERFPASFITDPYAVDNRHSVGIERMLWSSDYPHITSDWPYPAATPASRGRARRSLRGLATPRLPGRRPAPLHAAARAAASTGGRGQGAAPASGDRPPPSPVGVEDGAHDPAPGGSEVSLGQLLEHRLVELGLGEELVQPRSRTRARGGASPRWPSCRRTGSASGSSSTRTRRERGAPRRGPCPH